MTTVAELVATLGVQVDAASFAKADQSVKALATNVQKSVAPTMAAVQKAVANTVPFNAGLVDMLHKQIASLPLDQAKQKHDYFYKLRGLEAPEFNTQSEGP